ncbi:general transcription factor 3C polypeptide 1 [Embiotoca jacksoni]|uniref:general transcription factor 3C polypeptide 1 n=1 Tax=Embiotoca jacksoni TaxID=100190 RepID=UPI003704B462
MDPLSIVSEEVALEGLDGITIPTLWIRLQDRQPSFPLKLDDATKGLIWRSLTINTDLKFYELPKEREDVVLVDRYKNVDPDTGIEMVENLSENTQKEIYPIHIILENKDGIQGSCVLFKERRDVTKHVRSKSLTPLVSLEEALERYGRKLVVVASQTVRFRALIGIESDPDLKLNDDSYCALERVGRARWQGELQRDLHGCWFKIDARKFHYLRKSLVRHQLVTMQSYVSRPISGRCGQQQYSILLLLKRFHVNRRTKHDILMECVSNFLQHAPNQFATVLMVKEYLEVNDNTFKRICRYMRAARLIEYCQYPLEDLDPGAGPCTNKNGRKVMVRCVKLVKPYTKKGVVDDDDDDDEDEEDDTGARRGGLPEEGRIIEKDILSQAYHMILSSGSKGVPQRGISFRMNVGKLESRMICRRLEQDGIIKGFMEDEGRQRTTKFISHRCTGGSDQLQMFVKEQERMKHLSSSAPITSNTELTSPKTLPTSKSTAKEKNKTPAAEKNKKAGGGGSKDAEEEGQICDEENEDEESNGKGGKARGKSGARRKSAGEQGSVTEKDTPADTPIVQPPSSECETTACGESVTSMTPDSEPIPAPEPAPAEEETQSNSPPAAASPQTESLNEDDNPACSNNVVVCQPEVEVRRKSKKSTRRSHETYRLLRRKNLIVEAVCNFKIIEGFFPLQKIINDDEKQDGVVSKCCRKTIFRIVNCLSREGLLKMYSTTVIQDGITKKLEMIVHPSIKPTDDIVNQLIEQVRFKISSSYSAIRQQHADEKARELERESEMSTCKKQKSTADRRRAIIKDDFKPTTVRGLSKTLGYQPKMHRMRVIHNFLWYLIYGHPLRHNSTDSTSQTPTDVNSSNPDAKHADSHKQPDLTGKMQSQSSDQAGTTDSADQPTADTSQYNLETTAGDEVFADEDSWKRFIPPVRVHKDYSSGWAMVGDLLLCLPLSLYVQVIQVNYQVDGLEEYLDDPVKQHYLVRGLPARMRRQLLYKRKYIFVFHENLQKLVYMGLLQFGPIEKFKEKDQVFVYLKRNATIVDTTCAEPHYWLVTESPDKPFEKRQYTFNTAEDVENYWFDLMCVCLNTPLGIIRNKRNDTEDETDPPFVRDRNVFAGLAYLLKGSSEECDDGSIPGDGKGAAGQDCEFFAHLKRNWFWTNHLLTVKRNPTGSEAPETKVRLKSLLSKNALRIALKAGGSTAPRYVTTKRPLLAETVEMGFEPASRNQQTVGGKRQKRKRLKKDTAKAPRKKKKEPKKRTPAHDETDHQALKMMTRQRVYWSVQEDSLMMLCCVASHLLNSKLKRAFVPHCVVRDLLHTEFEISVDKTSVAVGRRSRYILKNPQTLLNYRICLAEVYQDKPLYKLLEEKKPADPDKPEDCAKAFSEYIRLLRQKFSTVLMAGDLIMPDNKQQLFSRFKVSAIVDGRQVSCKDTLTCTDDIHAIVLHNLIQSTLAMTNSQMKSSRSFQTFHMYSKYDQELLCQVFVQCRKRGLVNRRRVNQPFGPKKNRSLPILPMSYQLSQSYYRCFSWRFPHSLCTDSFRFLRNLIDNGTADDKPFTIFYHEKENRTESGEEVQEKQSGGKEDGGPVNEAQVQTEVANRDSIKEAENNQSKIDGEEKLMEVDVSNEKTEEMSKSEEKKDTEDSLMPEAPSHTEQTDDAPPTEEPPGVSSSADAAPPAPEDPPDVSDMLQFSLDSPGGACAVSLSLMSLGLLSVYLSIPKQMVVVDSSLVDNDVVKGMASLEEDDDDDFDGEECEGKKRLQVKAHQASHTNYLMMRGYCSPGIVKLRNLNTSDNIVMESCAIKLQLRNTPVHNVFSVENSESLDLTKCGPSLLPSVLTYSIRSSSSPRGVEDSNRLLVQQRGHTAEDIEACAQLRGSLDEAGENGLDERELHQAHIDLQEPQAGRTRSLQRYMKELQEQGQVVKVGSLGVRWVLMQHAEPWLLTVNSKQWSQARLPSDGHPFLENKHNNPFMRKRRGRGFRQEAEEPPAKKRPVNRDEDGDGSTGDLTREKLNEEDEQQKGRTDEGRGDELLNLEEEGGKQTQPEEDAGQEKMETRTRRDNKEEQKASEGSAEDERDEQACSPPEGSADDENVSFISRPWRMVDGKLNRQVCKGMLEAVLYHVMSRPGLTQQKLVEHYKNLLQPVAVLDLVESLVDLGCVTKKTVVRAPKPSLFARPAQQTRSETRVNVEDPDTVFYEPTMSCSLRLCQVLPNERHWKYWVP